MLKLMIFVLLPVFAQASSSPYDKRLTKAVESGKLSAEQALVYQTQARLTPEQIAEPEYRPTEAEKPELAEGTEQAIRSAQAQMGSLSGAAQAAVIPYLVSPTSPDSAIAAYLRSQPRPQLHDLREAAEFFQAPPAVNTTSNPAPQPGPDFIPGVPLMILEDTQFRVWWQKNYPAHEAAARFALSALNTAAGKLLPAFRKQILSDAGPHRFVDRNGVARVWNDGGNGKLDVYLFRVPGYVAVTLNYPPSCSEAPSFMVANPSALADESRAKHVIIHEFMHVVQNTFKRKADCDSYNNMDEGVASWATRFVDHGDDRIHTDSSFSHWGEYSLATNSYSTWPFYTFLEHAFGFDEIRKIYLQNAQFGPYQSIDKALSGGFMKQWPEYLVAEWNQLPNREGLKEWDGYTETPWESYNTPVQKREVKIGNEGHYIDDFNFDLEPLTRKYRHYVFKNADVRSVSLEAQLGYVSQKARLHILMKHAGQGWKVQDWSGLLEEFNTCQSVNAERIEEMVLIFSNVDYPVDGDKGETFRIPGRLAATNLPCEFIKGRMKSHFKTGSGDTEVTRTVVADVTYEADDHEHGKFTGRFHLSAASGTYTFDGKRPNGDEVCVAHETGRFGFDRNSPYAGLDAIGMQPHHTPPFPSARVYTGTLSSIPIENRYSVTYRCPNGKTMTTSDAPDVWIANGMQQATSGGKLKGASTVKDTTYEWDLGAP